MGKINPEKSEKIFCPNPEFLFLSKNSITREMRKGENQWGK